ncbi:MAG TPA: hypothetical protein VNV86_00205 [Candidatus Acidoferrum sp.]|nr:hypothetical protein [Candidatus Acidoferrum sp.]
MNPAPAERAHRYVVAALMVLAVAVRLFFWAYTDRVWEDALITVLHSENAVHGLGLTHVQEDGRVLQGFTSPFSVLVPLAGDLIRPGFGLSLIKLVSALCGALAVWLGVAICLRLRLPIPVSWMAGAFLALEHHQILWGMAGMETQIVVVCYLFAFLCHIEGRTVATGLALGLCMLARPDAALLVAILLAFEAWRSLKLRNLGRMITIGACLAGVFLPWLAFTTWYYGTPVPNTIVAKSLGYGMPFDQLAGEPLLVKVREFAGKIATTFCSLGPVWGGNGTGFLHLADYFAISIAAVLTLGIGGLIALRRRDLDVLPMYTFAAAYAFYFTFFVPRIFGWYVVPVVAISAIGVAYGLTHVCEYIADKDLQRRVINVAAAVYVLSIAASLFVTFPAERKVQQFVENGGRKQVGIYLGSVMKPGETVGIECLGYVGYYSHRVVYDFPGMCSRTVTTFLKTHPGQRTLVGMWEGLRPTYIAARNKEVLRAGEWLQRDYELVKVFKVPDDEVAQLYRGDRNMDLQFNLFRKK